MAAHGGDPARVHDPGPEHAAGLFGQGAGLRRVGDGRVADVGGGVAAGQGADHGDHAAVVLEVVVGVGDVVLAGVDVLGRHRDPAEGTFHVRPGVHAVESAAVGVAAPDRVDLGQVGVIAPVPR